MKILIVDDESAIRESLGLILRYEHHDVLTAPEGKTALALVEANPDIDLMFLDIKMPGRDGLDVLGDVLKLRPDAAVIVISGHATFETASPHELQHRREELATTYIVKGDVRITRRREAKGLQQHDGCLLGRHASYG